MNSSFGIVEIGFHSYCDIDETLQTWQVLKNEIKAIKTSYVNFVNSISQQTVNELYSFTYEDDFIVECEIPQGALFIEGKDEVGKAVYVSSEIKVIGEVICP